jgi:hypothetical protein
VIKTQDHPAGLGCKKGMVEIDSVPLNQEDIHPDLR